MDCDALIRYVVGPETHDLAPKTFSFATRFLISSDTSTWRNKTEGYWCNEAQIVIDSITLDLTDPSIFSSQFELRAYRR